MEKSINKKKSSKSKNHYSKTKKQKGNKIILANQIIWNEVRNLTNRQYKLRDYFWSLIANRMEHLNKGTAYEEVAKLSVIKLSAAEIMNFVGMDKNSEHSTLAKELSILQDQKLIYIDSKKFFSANYFSFISFDRNTGMVKIEISPSLAEFLFVDGDYTEYIVKNVKAFSCVYSHGLYRRLKMHSRFNGHKMNLTISEIVAFFNLSETYRKDFSLIRSRVIAPAIKDINAYTDIFIIEYKTYNSNGIIAKRNIYKVEFTFEENTKIINKRLDKTKKKPSLNKTKEEGKWYKGIGRIY